MNRTELRRHSRKAAAIDARVARRRARAAAIAERAEAVRLRQEAIARGEIAAAPGMRRNVLQLLVAGIRLEVAAEHPRWSAKSRDFGREVARRVKARGWS